MTTSVSPVEFAGNDDLAPVTHSYVKGISYLWTTGENELSGAFLDIKYLKTNPTHSQVLQLSKSAAIRLLLLCLKFLTSWDKRFIPRMPEPLMVQKELN